MLFGFCERTAWQMHRYIQEIITAKLTDAASAWWEADRQRLEAIIRGAANVQTCVQKTTQH